MSSTVNLDETPDNFLANSSFESDFCPLARSTDLIDRKRKTPAPLGESTVNGNANSSDQLDGLSFASSRASNQQLEEVSIRSDYHTSTIKSTFHNETDKENISIKTPERTKVNSRNGTFRLSQLLTDSKLENLSKCQIELPDNIPFASSKQRANFNHLALQSTPGNIMDEKKFVYGDFHAYRETTEIDATPIRKVNRNPTANLSEAWSSASSDMSQKTQIELDSKYFRPKGSKETDLTELLSGFGVNNDSTMDNGHPKPDLSIVPPRSNQEDYGFDDSDFLSGNAAMEMLEEHEAEFEEDNRLRLDSNFESKVELENTAFSNYSNDGEISKFFRNGGGELGLGEDDSPQKRSTFKMPQVPIEYGGATETVLIDRRDTVNTIKSMATSVFDSTEACDQFHKNLKAMDSDSCSFSLNRIQKEHEKLKADDTLDSIQGSHGKERYSIGSIDTELSENDPQNQSSPSKSSDSTDRHLESFDSMNSTNLEELCKTKCGNFYTLCSSKEEKSLDSNERSPDSSEKSSFDSKSTSSNSSKGSLLTRQRRSSSNLPVQGRMNRFASLPSVTGNYDQSHQGFQSIHPNPIYDHVRSFSPAPLVDYTKEVDFANHVFTGDSSTEMITIRPLSSWVHVKLVFRSISKDSEQVGFDQVPFVLRQTEFNMSHGQNVSIPIHFRPKLPGRYLSILELRSTQMNQTHPQQMGQGEQVFAINIIGHAIKPSIQIGDGSGNFKWEHNGKNKIDIFNSCAFDLPLLVEADLGYGIVVEGCPTNRLVVPGNTTVECKLVQTPQSGYDRNAKLKVYLDCKEMTMLDFCAITKSAPEVQLSGPENVPDFRVNSYSAINEKIVILNCGECPASINARVDGELAEAIMISPETASIPADGELIFSIKLSVGGSRPRLVHKLVLEIAGTEDEFVCPFGVTVVDSLNQSVKSNRSSKHSKTSTSSALSITTTTALASNRSILLWTKLQPGRSESKSLTLRGQGTYRIDISPPKGYQVFKSEKVLANGDLIKFNNDKDVLLTVKASPEKNVPIQNAKLNLVSIVDSHLKSCIPLISQVGNPVITIDGEAKKTKRSIEVKFGKGYTMKLHNSGGCDAFVHLLPPKDSGDVLIDPSVLSLKIGETKNVTFTSTLAAGSSEIVMYSGSSALREILAAILQSETGVAAWKKVLGKLNSAKLVRLSFGYTPKVSNGDELGLIPDNYVSIVNTFLRNLTVDSISLKFTPLPKKTHKRTPSIDSVPTKESTPKTIKIEALEVTPSLLDLNKENELNIKAVGVTKPVTVTMQYDSQFIRVAPTLMELAPNVAQSLIIIPLHQGNWVQSILLKTDFGTKSVGLKHLTLPRQSELVFSNNEMDFGLVENRAVSSKMVSLTNNDDISCSWLLIQQPGAASPFFSLSPRNGDIEPGKSMELNIKFTPPRVPGVFEQDWQIEYHKKDQLGLAKTIKKINLKTKGSTRLVQNFRVQPSQANFTDVTLDGSQHRKFVQLQNRTHEKMVVDLTPPEAPFAVNRQTFDLKPRYYIDLPIYLNTFGLERRLYESQITFTSFAGLTQTVKLKADLS